jgi:uncharacterized protein YcbK (DUF882 family)
MWFLSRKRQEVSMKKPKMISYAEIAGTGRVHGTVTNDQPLAHLVNRVTETARLASVIAESVGGRVRVVSGYRSKAYNEAINGAPMSQHVEGRAVDLAPIAPLTVSELHTRILSLIGDAKIPQGGVGLYRSFVHYDWRGTRARWDESATQIKHKEETT